jgi:hypothetical protein
VVFRADFDSPRPFEREFHGIQRFEPVSRSHEGLVDIRQVGRNDTDGYFYYVMELADPVAPAARRRPLKAKAKLKAQSSKIPSLKGRRDPATLTRATVEAVPATFDPAEHSAARSPPNWPPGSACPPPNAWRISIRSGWRSPICMRPGWSTATSLTLGAVRHWPARRGALHASSLVA